MIVHPSVGDEEARKRWSKIRVVKPYLRFVELGTEKMGSARA